MKMWTGLTAIGLLLASAATASAQQRVTITGCPVSGAVPGCVMIRGADNATYNITESRQRPELNKSAIRLTGFAVRRTSYCAQGILLENITWTYTNQPCR